jgi:hypothetical protein
MWDWWLLGGLCSDSDACQTWMFVPSIVSWIAYEKVAGETMQMLNHPDSHRYGVEITSLLNYDVTTKLAAA